MQVAQISTQDAWKRVYFDAIFELDPTGLITKLDAAERAIDERLIQALSTGTRREFTELEEAKRVILHLRRHELGT
jgi:hypothetical protein